MNNDPKQKDTFDLPKAEKVWIPVNHTPSQLPTTPTSEPAPATETLDGQPQLSTEPPLHEKGDMTTREGSKYQG